MKAREFEISKCGNFVCFEGESEDQIKVIKKSAYTKAVEALKNILEVCGDPEGDKELNYGYTPFMEKALKEGDETLRELGEL